MTAGGPTGSAPTGGSPGAAGSGDLLISGTSSAIFLNGANYVSAQLFAAGGSGVSLVGSGTVATVYVDGFFEWLAADDTVTLPAARMVYHLGILDNPFLDTTTLGTATVVTQKTNLTQAMTVGGSSVYVWKPGAIIVEAVRLTGAAGAATYMTVPMTQSIKVAQKQVVALLASVSEHMTLTPLVDAYLGTVMLNRLMMADQAQVTLKYAMTVTEALDIAETFKRFIGAFAQDSVSLGGTASAHYKAAAAITEFLALAIDQHYAMAFRLTVRDGLEIDDAALLNMVYRQTMNEIIDLEILLQSPSGSITSWAINTRSGAVTEYQGWSFNSFVQVGNRYVAANKDGLFELNGPTDAGLSVVADIVGAFLQPGGPHLAGLKGVYLGQSGTGYWLLKIDTGDGREYVYQRLSNPGLMTTKFIIGKGINARYIGWELINVEGQDFSLDSVEFVPMLRTRRI